MSNRLKILISFLIVILFAIVFYVFFFSGIFNIKFFNFLNFHLENRYQNELNKVSHDIENYLNRQNSKVIDPFIESFDLNKVIDKRSSRYLALSNELSNAKNLIVSESSLEKIKFYDYNRKLIFSTDNNEVTRKGNFLSFTSTDRIERRRDFYDMETDTTSFFFIPDKRSLVLKKKITSGERSIGLMLFYYNEIFLNDILRKNSFLEFKEPFYVNNNIIILSKPKFVPEEYLFSFKLDEGRLREIVYRDKSGNEVEKTYRLFFYQIKGFDLYFCRFIDNDIFILDRRNTIILFYFFLFTFYLLILALLFFRKTDFEKAKEKFFVFTAALLEEMIQAKSREELEMIHRHLDARKQIAFQNVLLDFKGLKEKDKTTLEDQIDSVFNKIEQSYQQRIGNNLNDASLERMEMLLEKFINTIAEKGIQLNTPVKIGAPVSQEIGENLQTVSQVSEAGEVTEVEDVEDLEDFEDVEDLEDVEDEKDIETAEVEEELEEVEEITEAAEEPGKVLEDLKIDAAETKEKLKEFPKLDEEKKAEETEDMSAKKQPEDIKFDDLFAFDDVISDEEAESIELLELVNEDTSHEEVPKIPEEYYKKESQKTDDELSHELSQLSTVKTPLQVLLDDIFKKIEVEKLFLLINIKKENSFIQIYQVGLVLDDVKKVILDEKNRLVQHIYSTKRMVYVTDIKKMKYFFNDEDFEKEYTKMKSLFIYPIEYFRKIRALIFFFFKKDSKDRLESLIEILDENKKRIRKSILKLI